MARPAVPVVEALSVDAVQVLHSAGDVRSGRLEEEVVVVPHQAVRVDPPGGAVDDEGEERQEQATVGSVAIDGCAVDSARRDVVHGAGEADAGRPGHSSSLAGAFVGGLTPNAAGASTIPFEPRPRKGS